MVVPACEKLQHALALNNAYGKAMIVLAKVLVEQARGSKDASARRKLYNSADRCLQKALRTPDVAMATGVLVLRVGVCSWVRAAAHHWRGLNAVFTAWGDALAVRASTSLDVHSHLLYLQACAKYQNACRQASQERGRHRQSATDVASRGFLRWGALLHAQAAQLGVELPQPPPLPVPTTRHTTPVAKPTKQPGRSSAFISPPSSPTHAATLEALHQWQQQWGTPRGAERGESPAPHPKTGEFAMPPSPMPESAYAASRRREWDGAGAGIGAGGGAPNVDARSAWEGTPVHDRAPITPVSAVRPGGGLSTTHGSSWSPRDADARDVRVGGVDEPPTPDGVESLWRLAMDDGDIYVAGDAR